MSDIDQVPDDYPLDEPAPAREGLPPRYRMRADAHYVDQLDSSLFSSPVRLVDVRSIDAPARAPGGRPAATFVESVRHHGVLQPLLLRHRAGRYEVIAGGKRLAAALAAGMRTVPCFVEQVEDDQARALAEATNVPSMAPVAEPSPVELQPALDAVAECLTAVSSSAGLLSRGTTLAEGVAVDLVRAEVTRALQLLQAQRVLTGVAPHARRPVRPRAVVDRAVEQTAPERRLRGVTLEVPEDAALCPLLTGDEGLLVVAVSSLVTSLPTLVPASGPHRVRLAVGSGAGGAVVFTATHDGTELPAAWRSKLAETEWPDGSPSGGNAAAAALAMIRAAQEIARLHGGELTVDCAEGSTSLSLSVPVRTA